MTFYKHLCNVDFCPHSKDSDDNLFCLMHRFLWRMKCSSKGILYERIGNYQVPIVEEMLENFKRGDIE